MKKWITLLRPCNQGNSFPMTPPLSTFFVKKKGGSYRAFEYRFLWNKLLLSKGENIFSIFPNIITLHMPRSGRWRILVHMTSSAFKILPTPTGTPKAFRKAYVNSKHGCNWKRYALLEYIEQWILESTAPPQYQKVLPPPVLAVLGGQYFLYWGGSTLCFENEENGIKYTETWWQWST